MSDRSIGIFDSGVGGLTVVRAVRAVLPGTSIVYLGDTARVPYGSKSRRTVERYSIACLRFLLRHQVSVVMVACNTASANAYDALVDASPVPIIGAVRPGAQSAVTASPSDHIGVIGTLATIGSGAYEQAIAELDSNALVTTLACPLLVPLAEEGWTDGEVSAAVARKYLAELFDRDPEIDTLVLGCTHYPLLRSILEQVAADIAGRAIAVVDSASAMARDAVEVFGSDDEGSGRGPASLRCFVTDATRLSELGPRFLGESLGDFELVDL